MRKRNSGHIGILKYRRKKAFLKEREGQIKRQREVNAQNGLRAMKHILSKGLRKLEKVESEFYLNNMSLVHHDSMEKFSKAVEYIKVALQENEMELLNSKFKEFYEDAIESELVSSLVELYSEAEEEVREGIDMGLADLEDPDEEDYDPEAIQEYIEDRVLPKVTDSIELVEETLSVVKKLKV